jgi:predicted small lipoprotein YifL
MNKLNWVMLVGASLVAAGCGQKGPLFLPDKNASVVTRPAPTAAPATQPEDKKKDDDQSSSATPPPKN